VFIKAYERSVFSLT